MDLCCDSVIMIADPCSQSHCDWLPTMMGDGQIWGPSKRGQWCENGPFLTGDIFILKTIHRYCLLSWITWILDGFVWWGGGKIYGTCSGGRGLLALYQGALVDNRHNGQDHFVMDVFKHWWDFRANPTRLRKACLGTCEYWCRLLALCLCEFQSIGYLLVLHVHSSEKLHRAQTVV